MTITLGAKFVATAAIGTEAVPGGEADILTSYERADDGLRTRDLQLGKLALYQLSYVRIRRILARRTQL